MNYFDEGQNCKKKFSSMNASSEFERHVYELFKDAHDFEKAAFIKGFLKSSKNETLFILAQGIANKAENNESLWAEILLAFNKIIKGKTKPSWGFNFVNNLISRYDYLKLNNYEVELLVYTVLNYESPVSCYWFGKMNNRPWFSTMEPDLKIAILKQAKAIPPNSKDCFILFETFRDFDFYKSLIEQNDSLVLFETMMKSIEKYKNNLMYFHDGFDSNSIMTKYKSKLIRSGHSLNSLVDILKTHYNSESGKLFVDLLDNCDFSNNHISIVLLKRLEDLNSDEINAKLYYLTGEEKYLPQFAKDFFIF